MRDTARCSDQHAAVLIEHKHDYEPGEPTTTGVWAPGTQGGPRRLRISHLRGQRGSRIDERGTAVCVSQLNARRLPLSRLPG